MGPHDSHKSLKESRARTPSGDEPRRGSKGRERRLEEDIIVPSLMADILLLPSLASLGGGQDLCAIPHSALTAVIGAQGTGACHMLLFFSGVLLSFPKGYLQSLVLEIAAFSAHNQMNPKHVQ